MTADAECNVSRGCPDLGAEIRRLRMERGISQRALTRLIGLSAHSNLADYESGRRLPPTDIVSACERVLGVADGRLHRMHAQALTRRASEAGTRVAGAAEVKTGPVAAAGGERAAGRRGRASSIRRRLGLTVTMVGGMAVAVVVGLTVTSSGSGAVAHPAWSPPHLQHTVSAIGTSPNGTPLTDGLDPEQAACDHTVTTLDSAEMRLLAPTTVNGHRLSAGTVIGHVSLRFSPDCQAAWARVDPMPSTDTPAAGTVDVNSIRPTDGTRTAFHLGHLEEAYGDMLLTGPGCVQAEGAINLSTGQVVTATTRCLTGRPDDPETEGASLPSPSGHATGS